MDRKAYEQGILSIISDTSKFKVNDNDPTLQREGKLQHCYVSIFRTFRILFYWIVTLVSRALLELCLNGLLR